jgi:hypothetical protein
MLIARRARIHAGGVRRARLRRKRRVCGDIDKERLI